MTTRFNEDFEIRYWQVDPDLSPGLSPQVAAASEEAGGIPVYNYVEQVNRFNLSLAMGDVKFEAQIDEVALFMNQYYLNDELFAERELLQNKVFSPWPGFSYINPEKLRLQVEKPKATYIVGDAYAAFGRGIALNVNRNVDIDLDTSIQGFKGMWRPGAWDVTLVAGQLNRQQVFQDNPNILMPPELRHTLAGFRAERFGLGPANIGAHGVYYNFVSDVGFEPAFQEVGEPADALAGGATVELSGVGGIDWYAEGDVFSFPTETLPTTLPGAKKDPGYAAYGSASFYPGKTVWLVEGKRYYQAERVNAVLAQELYEVGIAPTLEYERCITEDSSATINSNDVWGGRVRMDWALRPGLFVPYASTAVFRDQDLGALHFNDLPETVFHNMVGFELLKEGGGALVNAGYRIDDRDGTEGGADRQLHGDAAIKFPFVAGLHAEVQVYGEHYWWGVNEFQQDDYTEIETNLTVQKGSTFSVTYYTDFTRNPIALSTATGNISENLFGALELQYKPSPAVTMKAFYGGYKAGIRCAGGQCRQLPGFEGARFGFTGAF